MDTILKKIEYKISILQNALSSPKHLAELSIIEKAIKMLHIDTFFDQHSSDFPTENFLERLTHEDLLERLDKLSQNNIGSEHLYSYRQIKIDLKLQSVDYEVCDNCHNAIDKETNLMHICAYCNHIKYITSDHRSIPRSKIGNFNPHRHFKNWMERILGRESEEEIKTGSADVITIIKQDLTNKNKSIEHITIDDIRASLKEIKMTHLNKNTTLLAKKITNRSPPYISDEKYNKTYDLFIKVMNARDALTSNRCNRIYYPYYIYKIFNLILAGEEKRVTNYVHLHKEQTVSVNDTEWEKICTIVPELQGKYTPTIVAANRYV